MQTQAKKSLRLAPRSDAGAAAPDLESTVRTDEDLEIRVWLRLLVCVGLMEQEIRARLHKTFGVTIARFEILAQLYRDESGLGMKELSARLMVSKGNVTGLIVRMEDAGLIERRPDPDDGRAQTVSLTARGRKLFEKMRPLHNEWFRELMNGFSRRDMKQLIDLLQGLKGTLRNPK
jgi:DNA-binding MarR family transcriptional regulator